MKKVLSLTLASAMLLGTGTTALAADLDLINQVNSARNSSFNQVVRDTDSLRYVSENVGDYLIEYNKKMYKVTEVNQAMKDGAANFEAAIEGLTPVKDADEEVSELKVVEVSAINAKQVEVKFSKAVDVDTVIKNAGTDNTLVAANFTFAEIDGNTITSNTAIGKLSEDDKTLTITASGTEVFEDRYDITINGVKDKEGNLVEEYKAKSVDFGKDKTAPTVTTERVSSNRVKLKFSEPVIFSAGALTAKYADSSITPALAASDVTVGGTNLSSVSAAAGSSVSELEIDLGAPVKENKDIEIKLNGVADTAGNLLNPQPAKVTVVKLQADGIEPAITTITQTDAKKFTIKFNKDLDGNLAAGNVTVGGVATSSIKKISASEYEFTTASNLDGLQTVTVAANTAVDLAGEDNTNALSKVVTFKVDTAAPVASAALVKDKNNKEVIQLTFDKDVTAGNVTVAGKQVKDYITTTVPAQTVAAVYADGTGTNKKVLHVPLNAAVLAVENAAYDVKISSTVVESSAGVDMKDVEVKFTRGKDGQPENVNTHIVSNVVVSQSGDNDKVVVTFTIPSGTQLDGATATNVANYSVAGAQIESVTLGTASGTTQVATLNLKEDSNAFTGVRNITVKNVKVVGSTKVMEPKTITNVSLNENVRPTVTKSEVTKITQGSAQVTAVPGTATKSGTNASIATLSNESSANATGSKTFTIDSSGKLDDASATQLSGTTGLYAGSFTYNGVTVTIAAGSDNDTFSVSTTAAVAQVPAVSAETEVTLTFSENVTKTGAAKDFDLYINGVKSSATVTTAAGSGVTKLVLTIDEALTTTDFAKGVELRKVSTLDIADSVTNKLKVDAPIVLNLN